MPIAVAAVVTTRVIVASSREDYEATRTQTQDVDRPRDEAASRSQVADAVTSLTSRDHPFVGNLVRDFVKGNGTLDQEAWHRLRDQGGPVMRGLSLDVLAITGPDDVMLVSPHNRALTRLEHPEVRERATKTGGKPYFTIEKILTGRRRRVDARRGGRADERARQRLCGGAVGRPPGRRRPARAGAQAEQASTRASSPPTAPCCCLRATQNWAGFSKDPPLRTPLFGPDGAPVAYVEAAVTDRGLDAVITRHHARSRRCSPRSRSARSW